MIGSINTEIIERAGGINVVGESEGQRGPVEVSMEDVLAWNPDTIVTWDANFYEGVRANPLWQDLEAVERGGVFLSPVAPFGWIDRPPSLHRMMGLIWLGHTLHPDQWEGDLREETRAFYRTWQHVDLDEAALDRLLERAKGRS